MKKILSILLIMWSMAVQAGLPPTTSKGINDTSSKTTFNFDFGDMPVVHTGTGVKVQPFVPKNYIDEPNGAAIGEWVTYADAAQTNPVDGIGGSPASTFAVSTSSALRGTTNFLWTHTAANRQGEGFSYPFTVAPSDQGKVLQVSFEYKIDSGTYADNDLSFWIYDVTNAVLIQPAPYLLKNSGIIEKFAMEFQTNTTSTSYRLIAHVDTATATAYTIRFTNFNLGPQAKLYGADIETVTVQKFTSGSGTYTPTVGTRRIKVRMVGGGGGGGGSGSTNGGGTGSGGASTFGSSLLTANGGNAGGARAGAPGTGGTATIASPATGTALTGGLGNGAAGYGANISVGGGFGGSTVFGGAGAGGAGGSNLAGSAASANTGAGGGGGSYDANATAGGGGQGGGAGGYIEAVISSPLLASYPYAIGAGGAGGTAGTGGYTGGAGGSGYIEVIEYGLSASQIMSSDASTAVVATRAYLTANQTIAPNNTIFKVLFDATSFDKGSSWASNRYTVKSPGVYKVTSHINISATNVLNNGYWAVIYKNGSVVSYSEQVRPAAGTSFSLQSSDSFDCVAGDYFEMAVLGIGNNSVSTIVVSGGSQYSWVNIEKIQGPAQIMASDSVSALYTGAPPTGTIGAASNLVTYGTKVKDSHNGYVSGVYTVPVSGVYDIFAMFSIAGTRALNTYDQIIIQLDGATNIASPFHYSGGAISGLVMSTKLDAYPLLAGQTIKIMSFSTATGASFEAIAGRNSFSIKRVGNY